MWRNRLKIAVIEHDINAIENLLDTMPQMENEKEMREASYLIQEALKIFQNLQNKTASQMNSVEKSLSFLQSSEQKRSFKLDITS